MVRNSFVFYRSFMESANALPERMRLHIYEAIARYSLDQVEPSFGDGEDASILRAIWASVRPQLDANLRRFENGCKGKEYGRLGGAPKGNTNARKQPQDNPQTTPNEECIMSNEECIMSKGDCKGEDSVAIATKSKKKNPSFVPPTLEEIVAHARERGDDEGEAEAFYYYYDARGWRDMVRWRSAWAGWINRGKRSASKKGDSRRDFSHNTDEFQTTI